MTGREVLATLGQRRRMAGGIAAAALTAVLAIALMATAGWLLAAASFQPPILHLQMAIVGVRAFAIGRAAGRYLERVVSHDAAFRMLGSARRAAFDRLRPVAPVGVGRSSELMPRLVGDVDRLQDWPLRVLGPLSSSGIAVGLAIATVAWILPAAGLALLVAVVVAGGLAALVTARIAGAADAALGPLRSRLESALVDHVRALDLLRAYGAEPERRAAIEALDRDIAQRAGRHALAAGAGAGLIALAAGGSVLVATLIAAPAVADGGLDGPLAALVALIGLAVFEVWGAVPPAVLAWRESRAAAARVAESLPGDEALAAVPGEGGEQEPLVGVLELVGLQAAWSGSGPASAPVNLWAEPGEAVAIVGASGAGKSTLGLALVRLLESTGEYRIGGRDARAIDPDALRRSVLLAEQRPHIFDEDLEQNLRFAREDATHEELWAVLERVGLAAWARERDGLATRLGERGGLVSGGQAQRIALARALLADARILVLDEPTANVDRELAEPLLRDILEAARGDGRILLVISHAPLPVDLVSRTVRIRAAAAR
ncbi:thiol reductant ABC exporter subunit CydC [Agrococcus jenensis]|uniref:ATP-binding cassette subfamily C protein CydC n=1 Tax=Agrococcus jenensis TaxID=46353 RepID=A0A3N2AW40_9MICO|nr:thiol reductant ABC exporter subunit CydC [Agrococcus jenensis]ROR67239.1 ATP-binding cassette subfamily C protein CydC [Agrococcus jenensis]